MARGAWGKAVRDPLTWLLFVPTMALTFAWEPVRAIGFAWYWEVLIFVGGFTVLTMLLWWPLVRWAARRRGDAA